MTPSLEVLQNMAQHDENYDDPLSQEPSDNSEDVHDDWNNITKPGDHDVLLGRGGGTNNHAGNVKFRKLVNEHKMRYLACSKVDKPKVAREVVQLWRRMEPPGRFLARKDDSKKGPGSVKAADNVWFEVGDKKAREKASQCLRERTPDVLPYIRQLREQQDAITEQGVTLVQQHLQLQQDQMNGDAPLAFNHMQAPTAFPRRNSMPVPPEGRMPGPPILGRRTSIPGMQGPPQPNMYAPRRASLSAVPNGNMGMQRDGGYQQNYLQPEDDFYCNDMSEMEYQHNMMMMQQQLQMQQMQLERMRQQRAMQRRGVDPHQPGGYNNMPPNSPVQSNPHFDGQHGLEDHLHEHDPLPLMPIHRVNNDPTSQERRAPKRALSESAQNQGPAERTVPDRNPSNGLVAITGGLEDGELTLEEYRQQLEEYINSSQLPESQEIRLNDGDDDASDLEDDWEKEKEKAYEFERKRGVDRNISGFSMMSTNTMKSGLSMISGLSALSDLMSTGANDKERRELNKSLSSNISLMSELTDLSQNIDTLSLYDD